MNAEGYPNTYQDKEAIGEHCPDGWTGEYCARCSQAHGRAIKWPCHTAKVLRAERSRRGSHGAS